MKREIKFRAWDERWEVMYENFQFIKSGDENNDWIVFTASNIPFDSNWKDNPFLRQQLKIMQYTGLKDKEGTEIYEGDVCTLFTDSPSEVLFIDGAFGYMSNGGDYFISFAQNSWFKWHKSKSDEIKVIGNIYQHPHLIKK